MKIFLRLYFRASVVTGQFSIDQITSSAIAFFFFSHYTERAQFKLSEVSVNMSIRTTVRFLIWTFLVSLARCVAFLWSHTTCYIKLQQLMWIILRLLLGSWGDYFARRCGSLTYIWIHSVFGFVCLNCQYSLWHLSAVLTNIYLSYKMII